MPDHEDTTAVRKIARIQGHPGRHLELHAALAQLERDTRGEPGCVEFGFFQSISDPDRFVLLEHFVDAAALQAHLQLPHTRAFFAAQLVRSVQAVDVPSLGAGA